MNTTLVLFYACIVSFRLMAYICNTGSFGPFCDEASITEVSVINKCLPKLNSGLKNGIVFELNEYQKAQGFCF